MIFRARNFGRIGFETTFQCIGQRCFHDTLFYSKVPEVSVVGVAHAVRFSHWSPKPDKSRSLQPTPLGIVAHP